MDKVNVLVVSRLDLPSGYLKNIAAVDPRLLVRDGSELFVAELRSKGRCGLWVDRVEATLADRPEEQFRTTDQSFDELLAQAQVIYAMVLIPDNLVQRAPKLTWIHLGNTGIEPYLSAGITDPRILMTNSRGAQAISIAEHAIAFALALAKGFAQQQVNKQNRLWERFVSLELRDRVMGLIGLGTIGIEIAQMARGIGMKVIGTKRSATSYQSDIFGVDELYPRSDLLKMISRSDFVVLAAPLTPETRGMIGEVELRAMKATAFLINISRGQIVDQGALTRALRQGSIGGAGLDVFETEPLPPESELWALPNTLLSPHMSGFTDRRDQRVVGMFCENLRRYLAGQKLLNLVDLERGY